MEALINNTQTHREQQEISTSWWKYCLVSCIVGERLVTSNLTTITDPNVQTIFIILIAFPTIWRIIAACLCLITQSPLSVCLCLTYDSGLNWAQANEFVTSTTIQRRIFSLCVQKFKKFWISCFSFLQLEMLIDVADINYFSCTIMSIKGLLISADICG